MGLKKAINLSKAALETRIPRSHACKILREVIFNPEFYQPNSQAQAPLSQEFTWRYSSTNRRQRIQKSEDTTQERGEAFPRKTAKGSRDQVAPIREWRWKASVWFQEEKTESNYLIQFRKVYQESIKQCRGLCEIQKKKKALNKSR